jgi:hypothetical protein
VAFGAWDVEREASNAAAKKKSYAAGVAFETLEEVNPYPWPVQFRWLAERRAGGAVRGGIVDGHVSLV